MAVSPHAAKAQLIVGNAGGGGNQFPFTARYIGEYQQVYAASAFSGPVTISQIAFASSSFGSANNTFSFTGTLGLGTTSATPGAPGTSYAANKRPDFVSVFSGIQNAALQATNSFDLVFNVTPFVYNPSNGNLLLDVVNANMVQNNTPAELFVSASTEPNLGRVYNAGGNGPATSGLNDGLRTRFTINPVSNAAPEPGSIALFVAGAVPFAGSIVRRRKTT